MTTAREKSRVFVFGASGHAKVVIEAIERQGKHEIAFLVDDDPAMKGKTFMGYRIIGGREDLLAAKERIGSAVVAIGSNEARRAVAAWLSERGFGFATVVHPRAVVARGVQLGAGSVLMAGTVINADALIGDHVIVNTGATVDHDCRIGEFVHVAPGSHLCGSVSVGRNSFICAGVTVVPNRSIGDDVTVGAGSTVLDDLRSSRRRHTGKGAEKTRIIMNVIQETKLAIDGGAPVRQQPFAPWPYFAPDEVAAASEVLVSGKVNYWTGEQGRTFEREFAALHGTRYAVALANGTVALELALHAFGIGPGDEVITTSRTFIASASCAVMRGAKPVLADVDRVSQNITAETIGRRITPKTRAIVAVHLAGWPCDMDPIMELARQHDLKVIEDCAQSLGSTYKGRLTGTLGHAAAFSFCQDKIITTAGEGGMLTTNDREAWQIAWSFKDHGKSWDAVYNREHAPGFRWLHESFGTNWRMTEIQSAIGRVQLRKLPEWLHARRTNAEILQRAFLEMPALRVTVPPEEIGHAWYKYYAFVRAEMLKPGWTRDRVMAAISAEGIPCFSGSCSEIYLEKAFDNTGFHDGSRLPVAKELGETSLMFLVHPTLGANDMEHTASAVAKVLEQATR
jgi:sugar O-acyltransferase (sialic acid O-acetyltransferase NeuD family)